MSTAHRNGKRHGASRQARVLALLCALMPLSALARPGYTNLINGYCREQGAPRLRYTDDGCALCHHPGTFTSDPAHRVEPVWSEFELARESSDYSFFCPTAADTGSAITSADLAPQPAIDLPAPSQGGPLSHAEMPWMSLGYPTGHTTVETLSATGSAEPASPAVPAGTPTPKPAATAAVPASVKQPASDEAKRQLDKLRDDLGISRSQQATWLELQDAVLAARPELVPATSAVVTPPLSEQLEIQQRHHALRIARLRAVNTALVRMNAQLNDRQQRLLAARLPAMLAGP